MRKSTGLLLGLAVPAFMWAGAIANPALAQGKTEIKVLLENDKVRAIEVRSPPGAEGANVARPFRVVRAMTDATIERTYPDGKKETLQWKAGEVRAMGPDKAFVPKNIGKSEYVLYVVEMK